MKFKLPLFTIIAFVFFAIPLNTSAQSKTITQAEYWSAVSSAYTSTHGKFPRREVEQYEAITDGKVSYLRIKTAEYRTATEFRIFTRIRKAGGDNFRELIQIGNARYCREDSSEWKTTGCYENPPAALEDAYESSFALQKSGDGITFKRTASYLGKENGKIGQSKFVTVDTLIVNLDSSIRDRTIVKSIFETKTIVSRVTEKYEYGMSLMPLEAPIK